MYQFTHWAVAAPGVVAVLPGAVAPERAPRLQGLAQGLGGGACVGGAHGSGRCDRCPRRRVVRCRRWTGDLDPWSLWWTRPSRSPPSRCLRRRIACSRAPTALSVPRAAAGGPADDPAGEQVHDEGGVAEPRPGRHVGVGSAGGALPAFSRVGFRRPPSEPDVRIPAHPALHPCYAVAFAASGTGDAGSPVAVAGHGDPAGSEELDSVVPDAPPGQEPAVDGVLVQAGVALVEPAEYSPEGEVVNVAERALGDPVLEIGAPASEPSGPGLRRRSASVR